MPTLNKHPRTNSLHHNKKNKDTLDPFGNISYSFTSCVGRDITIKKKERSDLWRVFNPLNQVDINFILFLVST